jgi:hypothetical protein
MGEVVGFGMRTLGRLVTRPWRWVVMNYLGFEER